MSQGLSVSRLINVLVNLTPIAAQGANLNSLLILGDSNVINVSQRILSFDSISEVATVFQTTDPEYIAATRFFSQVPQPSQLYIGRWAQTATAGILYCGVLSAAEQTIATWQAIVAGQFKINLNGTGLTNVTCGSFAAAANLNAVAAIIQIAVRAIGGGGFALATVVWNGQQFVFTSGTTGVASTVAALTAGAAADISVVLKGTAPLLSSIVGGIAAETMVQAVVVLDGNALSWYGLTLATTHVNTNAEYLPVCDYIEAAANPHILGISSQDAACYDPNSVIDIAYVTGAANYNRTFVQYSAAPYVCASFFGRAVTVNFNGSNTTLTMMYKVEPGVTAEGLSSTQANALQNKSANVFVNYNNGTAIIQYGTVASGAYFDDIFGLDWLKQAIQTAVFNLLYTTPTKIPQTDAGNQLIANTITQVLVQSVNNGLVAPGQWNSAGFGQLKQGQFLNTGYYIFFPPIATQLQADREARKSVPFQIAVKLAGAIHTVDILVNVNR